MNVLQQDLVSVIVRTHSPDRTHLLEETIKSISDNLYRPIEVVLVAQTKDDSFLLNLHQLVARFRHDSLIIKLVVNATNKDERARNLNLGISQATGRYIGFLDEDDVYYNLCISLLLNPLMRSDSIAWAYGDVALVSCHIDEFNMITRRKSELPFKKKDFSLDELFRGNFIPINSYLLDREKIDSNLLRFDESYTLAEDYAFLLKISTQHIPKYIDTVVSEYRVFDNLSNSTLIMNDKLGVPSRSKIKAWSYALWKIEILKESLMPNYSSGFFSLKTRKYIFYKIPSLKILIQYRIPILKQLIASLFKRKACE